MARNGEGIVVSFKAGANLSTHQYKFVYLSAADTVSLVSATTQIAVGILQNAPTSGQDASVMIMGVSKVVAGGNLARGELVSSANGTAVKNTLGTHQQRAIYGQVIDAVTSSGATISTVAINCASPALFERALA